MKVSVYLHTILARQTPEGEVRCLELELPPGGSMADLLQQLQLPLDGDQIMLVVNGVMVDEGHLLKDGDRVNLMPAISGG
ncbi:MAG: MoaD/ThiS family protein [Anaerolineales bacterium]|jgi:sulfur carrier protein ThiS|nr:MoaD/ThiS family protein [Anaerolineales bacterium]